MRGAAAAELGREPEIAGITFGADMRRFTERGIPCAMLGPNGFELAHCVDERVPVADVVALGRTLVRVALRFAGAHPWAAGAGPPTGS